MNHNINESIVNLATPIDELKHLDGNPRRGDINAIAKSYDKFGQRKPIVATKDGTVISGNHQLESARKLGWSHIAVVFTDDDELTAKAFAIADNRTSELGTIDQDFLADMLSSLESDPDILEAISYTEQELFEIAGTMSFDEAFGDIETGDRSTMYSRTFYFDEDQLAILDKAINGYKELYDLDNKSQSKTKALINFCEDFLRENNAL